MRRQPFGSLLLIAATACGSGGGTPTSVTPGTVAVSILDYSFSPSGVTIKVGATVRWTNIGGTAHTATSDGGIFNSGQLASPSGGSYGGTGTPGGSYQTTFATTGTFGYHCANHTYMTGTITVTP
jgi:plastocyanin